jgi:hypothetical protein
VSGQPLDAFLDREVFSKLGMADTHYRLSSVDAARTAPTEIAPPRGYPLRGEVHDENAWALGGVAGHAGLFSTASDLSVFAQMMLDGGIYGGVRIVADSTVALFTRRAAGHRALGWDTCDGGAGCGQHLSERAFGHTGFTGTSLWIDPDRQVFVILLTTGSMRQARRPSKVIADVRNDLADAAVLAVMDDPGGVLAMPVSFRADAATDWNRPLRSSSRARSTAASRKAAARCAPPRRRNLSAKAWPPSRPGAGRVARLPPASLGSVDRKKPVVKSAAKSTPKSAASKRSSGLPPRRSRSQRSSGSNADSICLLSSAHGRAHDGRADRRGGQRRRDAE